MKNKPVLLSPSDLPSSDDMKFAADRLAKDIQILESYGVESKNKEAEKLKTVLIFLEQLNIQRKGR